MEQAANLYSPLSLAYLGDAVYSLLVRERLMREHLAPAGVLHRYAARYVSAAAQSRGASLRIGVTAPHVVSDFGGVVAAH